MSEFFYITALSGLFCSTMTWYLTSGYYRMRARDERDTIIRLLGTRRAW